MGLTPPLPGGLGGLGRAQALCLQVVFQDDDQGEIAGGQRAQDAARVWESVSMQNPGSRGGAWGWVGRGVLWTHRDPGGGGRGYRMPRGGPPQGWPRWYLEYFWKPISLGTESGKMTRMQRAERVKRWSTYQGGGGGGPLSVPLGYKESHTAGGSVCGGQQHPKGWPKEVGSITSCQGQGAPHTWGGPKKTPGLPPAHMGPPAPHPQEPPAPSMGGAGNNSRFSSWSPTTLRRATEIMKRLRRKQTSQSFPAAAPHTARTTPW